MKNSPIMCNYTGCGKSEEFPDGDYCCEKKEPELDNVLLSMPGLTAGG